MRNMWTITKREYIHYFVSPMAYAVALMFLVILGLIFIIGVTQSAQPNATASFGPMLTIFLFFAPVLTMRLLADEQRAGTLELLLTSPIREWELVVGKWLGSWLFAITLILLTMIYPLILVVYGNPDLGPVYSSFIGLSLLVGAVLAIGVFASSLTSNVVVAAALGLLFALGVWIIRFVSSAIEALTLFTNSSVISIIEFLDFNSHFSDTFSRGIIDTSDAFYYISVIAIALYIATRVVQSRRWR